MSDNSPHWLDQELSALLRHEFTEPRLLRLALTHPSAAGSGEGNYDRLEFLGDRVLGLVIAQRLHQSDVRADAGDLAVRYNSLVRKETVATVARNVGIGQYLRMSRSEEENGGREKEAILANALEAILGALFIDGGLSTAERFINEHWAESIAQAPLAEKDSKTQLQERVQSATVAPPRYEIVDQSGPAHKPLFTVEVHIEGQAPKQGVGRSRRHAEQAAAEAMLAALDDATRAG